MYMKANNIKCIHHAFTLDEEPNEWFISFRTWSTMSAQFRIPTHPTAVERARRLTQDYEASCVCASVKKWDLYGLLGYGHPSQNRTPMNAYVNMDKRIRDMAIAHMNGDISASCCVIPPPSSPAQCKSAKLPLAHSDTLQNYFFVSFRKRNNPPVIKQAVRETPIFTVRFFQRTKLSFRFIVDVPIFSVHGGPPNHLS